LNSTGSEESPMAVLCEDYNRLPGIIKG